MATKILFINAIDPAKHLERLYQPLGLCYLASYLRKQFGENAFEFKIAYHDIDKELEKFKPDIVGITSVSQNFNIAKKYAAIAKAEDVPVLIGGTHISVLPQNLTENMDVGLIGEGEQMLTELMLLYEKSGFDKDGLKKIDGLVFYENGKLMLTKKRKLIEPLDSIPFPARDLIEVGDTAHVFSSRGCPYRCSFCASCRFWGKTRFFSAQYVVNEIKEVINNYNVKTVAFWDDLFIADKQRLEEFVRLVEQEGINEKVGFGCTVRANLIDDKTAKLLKRMRAGITMGLESGNERALRYLKGDSVTVEQNSNAIKILRENGVSPNATFIIGSPQETNEEILETLSFIKNSGLDFFSVYVLTPLPGTPVWDYAKQRKLVSEDMNWDLLDLDFEENHEKAIILSECLDREELYNLYKKFQWERKKKYYKVAFNAFLYNPLHTSKKILNKIKEKIFETNLRMRKID